MCQWSISEVSNEGAFITFYSAMHCQKKIKKTDTEGMTISDKIRYVSLLISTRPSQSAPSMCFLLPGTSQLLIPGVPGCPVPSLSFSPVSLSQADQPNAQSFRPPPPTILDYKESVSHVATKGPDEVTASKSRRNNSSSLNSDQQVRRWRAG